MSKGLGTESNILGVSLIGQETNKIKVHSDSFAEIWNKSDRFLSLLKVNDDGHDHEADQAEFEGTYYKLTSDTERL